MLRETTDKLVVHCSATTPDMDIGAQEIDHWHKRRGWLGIGYHAIIRRDGSIEFGRHFNESGAHAKDYNKSSVGVCLIGGVNSDNDPEDNFTPDQMESLKVILDVLIRAYPNAEIIGHNEISNKACPSFDVKEWLNQMNG